MTIKLQLIAKYRTLFALLYYNCSVKCDMFVVHSFLCMSIWLPVLLAYLNPDQLIIVCRIPDYYVSECSGSYSSNGSILLGLADSKLEIPHNWLLLRAIDLAMYIYSS